ncbi:18010_t:CDS:1, partial [Funneliformis geosporum]
FGIDSYKNSFYRSFEIIKYNIPLRVSNENIIKEFLKNSLIVKNYVNKM